VPMAPKNLREKECGMGERACLITPVMTGGLNYEYD
jgi:hypothetical protein